MLLRATVRHSVFIALLIASRVYAAPKDCAALAHVALVNAAIQTELVTGKEFKPPAGKPVSDLPGFCRAQLTLTPSGDSKIQVELWLPLEKWNGKLQGVGNGGYAGSINYDGLAQAVRINYAAVATDTGHEGAAEDATWALNHPEKITDFGYRAIHLMTADAKVLIKAFYGTALERAYFNSCSDGGREALMEAQRFPGDYDGIVAGAPANYWTHLVSNAVVNAQAMSATEGSYIPPSKLPAIQSAAQAACDLNDQVKDNVIEDPEHCHFDTSVLLCKGPDAETCLTGDQITTLNKLYAGGHFANGKAVFPGYAPGGEAAKGNWEAWITGPSLGQAYMFAYGTQFFKNMVFNKPDWDFHSFEADQDVKVADEKLAGKLNATNADLHGFVAHGGKLILYHGWDDAAISPFNTINYYEAVRKEMGASQTDQSVRLFMVPGMQHCFGGNGASIFGQFGAGAGDPARDIDAALVQWVEKGIAPDKLVAIKPGTQWTHPLCVYPATAHYSGNGDSAAASSYTCSGTEARKEN